MPTSFKIYQERTALKPGLKKLVIDVNGKQNCTSSVTFEDWYLTYTIWITKGTKIKMRLRLE